MVTWAKPNSVIALLSPHPTTKYQQSIPSLYHLYHMYHRYQMYHLYHLFHRYHLYHRYHVYHQYFKYQNIYFKQVGEKYRNFFGGDIQKYKECDIETESLGENVCKQVKTGNNGPNM